MKIVFVSNYINHHQIPFCNAMNELLQGQFTFIQTEVMEEERLQMGWELPEVPGYVHYFYKEEEFCRQLILDCEVVLFGGTEDESYLAERLKADKLVIRISERLYKEGQWKALSPRGLKKKYADHTRYRKKQVYLLCAGAYVPSDFHLIRAYPRKMFCWGYFPETRHYDIDQLMDQKGYGEEKIPSILWAGRMIDWKQPDLALEVAAYLKRHDARFHLEFIGDGPLRSDLETVADSCGMKDCVSFSGYQPPEKVRQAMEKADIFLFTSNRREGWGAVANEAMNSGCALLADHMIGAVPYLINNGHNGLIYEDRKKMQLYVLSERLVRDSSYCRQLGKNAYQTITEVWNAENAAERLMELIKRILEQGRLPRVDLTQKSYPCAPAKLLSERKACELAWEKQIWGAPFLIS